MSWGMVPKNGTEKWQSVLVPPTPILLTLTAVVLWYWVVLEF